NAGFSERYTGHPSAYTLWTRSTVSRTSSGLAARRRNVTCTRRMIRTLFSSSTSPRTSAVRRPSLALILRAFRALAAAEPRHRYVRPLHSKPSPGTELSGFLGFAMLRLLELKLDYRDGLVDLEYDTKRVQPSAR